MPSFTAAWRAEQRCTVCSPNSFWKHRTGTMSDLCAKHILEHVDREIRKREALGESDTVQLLVAMREWIGPPADIRD